MNKMAAMPIYGKNFQKSSSQEAVDRFSRNLVCSILNTGHHCFIYSFIEACDLKVGRCRQLVDFLKRFEYSRLRSFFDLGPR